MLGLSETVLVTTKETKTVVLNVDIFLGFLGFVLLSFFFSFLLQRANRREKQMPAPFFFNWLPRHKQDAGSYKDSIKKKYRK